ncbi:hypothetical protein M427DRAFT_31468 [Gonapodya prolifera JEL478]|uniref:Glycoside hydrolase family 38 protein n=1 Tax=Gonapodya prolifera (strain JEL478) TaxID=1344416 RepID=A0A139AHN3_GONPJ|nr:hypothetical protein M427DRAFT_31468 [Gonapodya prolifera JEL478]|eukprot:KXS16332.1 hypothetical protein M427DRAFT_31468 [Gonapodya prolifera JEL478]
MSPVHFTPFSILLLFFIFLPTLATSHFHYSQVYRPSSSPLASTGALNDRDHVKQVFVVWSWHLDLGFTISNRDGFSRTDNAASVVDRYFTKYFADAIEASRKVYETSNGTEKYIYTTHAWLLSMYLDECPPNARFKCPTEEEKRIVVEAIRRGDLTYHAFPFNTQIEYGSADLARSALQLTRHIDDLIASYPNTASPNRNRRKTVVSQRDVPGMTQAAIPILTSEGVRAVSFGCNAASAPVGVPHNRPFMWRNDGTGDEVLAMYNDGGYGWEMDPVKHLFYLPTDAVNRTSGVVPERPCPYGAIFAWWAWDNAGPFPVEDIHTYYAQFRDTYPHAEFTGATLEDVADAFFSPECRPLLETIEGEMGDSWIYGVASDPYKTGAFRALMRAREECGRDPECEERPRYMGVERPWGNFSRWLLKGMEHTWGGSYIEYLGVPEYLTTWTPPLFRHHQFLHQSFREIAGTWQEQRYWALEYAVQALEVGGHALARRARAAVEEWWLSETHSLEPASKRGSGGTNFREQDSHYIRPRQAVSDTDDGRELLPESVRRKYPIHVEPGEIVRSHVLAKAEEPMWEISFGTSGAIRRLVFMTMDEDKINSVVLAAPQRRLFDLEYRVYDQAEFDDFGRDYSYLYVSGYDLSKQGLPSKKLAVFPHVHTRGIWWDGAASFVVIAEFPSDTTVDQTGTYGAPRGLVYEYVVIPSDYGVQLSLKWKNKLATRIPESISLIFDPPFVDNSATSDSLLVDVSQSRDMDRIPNSSSPPAAWIVEKLDQPIDTSRVLFNGSQNVHATFRGFGLPGAIWVEPEDAALVVIGGTSAFPRRIREAVRQDTGASVSLFNNLWGTNYLQWFPIEVPSNASGSGVWRFSVRWWGEHSPEWKGTRT